MKKFILILIICFGIYQISSHYCQINQSKVQIDQVAAGVNALVPLIKKENKISFMVNSPEEMKIYFETQFILTPMILEKGWHDNKFMVYIEDFNHPPNEGLPIKNLQEIKRISDDRFHFVLYKQI